MSDPEIGIVPRVVGTEMEDAEAVVEGAGMRTREGPDTMETPKEDIMETPEEDAEDTRERRDTMKPEEDMEGQGTMATQEARGETMEVQEEAGEIMEEEKEEEEREDAEGPWSSTTQSLRKWTGSKWNSPP